MNYTKAQLERVLHSSDPKAEVAVLLADGIKDLMGKWAAHKEHGEVLVISDRPHRTEGKVAVVCRSKLSPDGKELYMVYPHELDFGFDSGPEPESIEGWSEDLRGKWAEDRFGFLVLLLGGNGDDIEVWVPDSKIRFGCSASKLTLRTDLEPVDLIPWPAESDLKLFTDLREIERDAYIGTVVRVAGLPTMEFELVRIESVTVEGEDQETTYWESTSTGQLFTGKDLNRWGYEWEVGNRG